MAGGLLAGAKGLITKAAVPTTVKGGFTRAAVTSNFFGGNGGGTISPSNFAASAVKSSISNISGSVSSSSSGGLGDMLTSESIMGRRTGEDTTQDFLDTFGSDKTGKVIRSSLMVLRDTFVETFETARVLRTALNQTSGIGGGSGGGKKGGGGGLPGMLGSILGSPLGLLATGGLGGLGGGALAKKMRPKTAITGDVIENTTKVAGKSDDVAKAVAKSDDVGKAGLNLGKNFNNIKKSVGQGIKGATNVGGDLLQKGGKFIKNPKKILGALAVGGLGFLGAKALTGGGGGNKEQNVVTKLDSVLDKWSTSIDDQSKDSAQTSTQDSTITGDLTTITVDGKKVPRGLSGPMETFGGKGGSTYTHEQANAMAKAFDNQPVYQLQKLRNERSALERGPDGKIKDRKRYDELSAEISKTQKEIIVSRGGTLAKKKKKGGGFGLKRMIGGAADQLTGNLFDFDKRSGGGLLRKTAGAVGGVARGIGRGLKRGIGGALDFATLGMFDFDKRNRKGAPKGFGLKRIMGGLADAATGGLTDFDKRGAGLLQFNPLFGGKDKAWGKEPGTKITTNNFSDSVKYSVKGKEVDPNSLEAGVPIEKAKQDYLEKQIRMLEIKKRRTKGNTSEIDKQLNALKIKYNNTLEYGARYNVKATPQNTSVPTDPKKTPKVVNVPSSGAPSGENNTGSPGGGTVNVSGNSGGGPTIAFPPSHNGVSYAAVETQSQMNLVMAD